MCGICGKVYFDPLRPVEPDALLAMCRPLAHRGPDEEGLFTAGPVGLGSTRLSIIDVECGKMPISNEDGDIWVVYNGEIYNFPELRADLERAGHRFSTRTDTEVLVHLYEEHGDRMVQLLDGMFAFALWDGRGRRLLLGRDQVGIKPLYYAVLQDRLIFASEIKALLVEDVDRSIDPTALHDYLSLNYVPGPRTIFQAVRKLQAGSILTFDLATSQVAVTSYWDLPEPRDGDRPPDAASLEDELLALLRRTVRGQMISDVPVGAFLSGGIDSSLIVALMSECADRRVKTFSLGFHEESYSELPYARSIAQRFDTEHHELIVQPRAHDLIAAMAEHFDEPFADSSALAVFAVSGLASEHVKVVLSGDGGDEVFGGYYTYQADRMARLYRRLPRGLGNVILPWLVDRLPVSDAKASLDFKLRRFVAGGALAPLPAHYSWKAYMSEEDKHGLYAAPANGRQTLRPSVELLQEYYSRYNTRDWMNRMLYVDTKVQLVDDMLTKVDRMSMAHSLEVRVPLLGRKLLEFMSGLPSDLKVRGLTLKYLLKRVARRVLPAEVLQRRKAGFTVPIGPWVKTDLRDMVRDYLSPHAIAAQGVFDPQAVQRLLEAHWNGHRNHSHNIWTLLMFSLWHERYASAAVTR